MAPELVSACFNITEERAQELIDKYAKEKFRQFLRGDIKTGDLLASFINIEELTTNEKCFLTMQSTTATITALGEIKKRMILAELIGLGGV